MRVISVPGRLQLASAMLLLAIPAIAIQTVIVTRAPWWKLPVQTMEIWAGIFGAIALPLCLWLQGGRRWALSVGTVLAVAWIAISAWLAIRTRQPSLGFFTLFLVVFFSGVLSWLDRELGRSFFDPQIRWFQQLPKPLPGLSCELLRGGAKGAAWESFRVSRMDEEGVFLFREYKAGQARTFTRKDRLSLKFSFRDRQVEATGVPVRDLRGGWGVGVQFKGLKADSYKEIGDFVELLRGEGHVA
jgi:hypothetical protein